MTMQWRWLTIDPEIRLTLTLDSTDPALIERVEASAKANGIALARIEAPDDAPLPEDYAESAE